MIKQAVILAGGKGERISKVYKNTPKSLIKIFGKPILQYQLETLEKKTFLMLLFLHIIYQRRLKILFQNIVQKN